MYYYFFHLDDLDVQHLCWECGLEAAENLFYSKIVLIQKFV